MTKLKCKFCEWTTQAWYTNEIGQKENGYHRLHNHVECSHPEEYDKIEKALKDEFDGFGKE